MPCWLVDDLVVKESCSICWFIGPSTHLLHLASSILCNSTPWHDSPNEFPTHIGLSIERSVFCCFFHLYAKVVFSIIRQTNRFYQKDTCFWCMYMPTAYVACGIYSNYSILINTYIYIYTVYIYIYMCVCYIYVPTAAFPQLTLRNKITSSTVYTYTCSNFPQRGKSLVF